MAKILSVLGRAGMARIVEPVAHRLLRAGVTPNMVTVAGTAGAVAGALVFAPRGHLVPAALIVTVFALTDSLDGAMARAQPGGVTRFGAVLDSTMDRVADAAVLAAVAWYYAGARGELAPAGLAIFCLIAGFVVSYVKARAEGLGIACAVGLAERTERLILIGLGGLLTGFGVGWGLPVALGLLAVLSVVTVGQRLAHVHRQSKLPRGAGA